MKHLFKILMLLSLNAFPQAENVTIKWGKGSFNIPNKDYIAPENDYILYDEKYGTQYLMRPSKKDYFLVSSFDTNLIAQKEEEIPVGDMLTSYSDDNFIQTDSRYLWFYSTWDSKTKQDYLFAKEYNFGKKSFFNKPIEILVNRRLFGRETQVGLYQFGIVDKYVFHNSTDGSKNLIHYQLWPNSASPKKRIPEYGFVVFDNEFIKLWSIEYEMPYVEEMMAIKDVLVSKSGDAFALFKIYNEPEKEFNKEGKSNYKYQLFKFSKKLKKPQIVDIELDGKFIDNFHIVENDTNVFDFYGYFNNSKKDDLTNGSFYFSIDGNNLTKSSVKKRFYEFGDYFKNENLKVHSKQKKEKLGLNSYSIPNLSFSNLLYTNDGGYYLIGEKSYVQVSNNGGETYVFEDIVVSKFDEKDNLVWIKTIPKLQRGNLNMSTLSFNYILDENSIYFFYFDNLKNLSLDMNKPPLPHIANMGGQLIVAKMDDIGNLSRSMILDLKDEKIKLEVNTLFNVGNKTLIGKAYSQKEKYRPIKISIK